MSCAWLSWSVTKKVGGEIEVVVENVKVMIMINGINGINGKK